MTDIVTKTRDGVVADYERDYLNRVDDADAIVGPGTWARLNAVLLADQLMPLYANTQRAGEALDIENLTLAELRTYAASKGVTLPGASGSSGYVTITAATGGTTYATGASLIEPSSRAEFRVTAGGTFQDGEDVPVASLATGPGTNLEAGTVLQWSSPPAGSGTTCVVAEQTDGSGLTGGADEEDREQILNAIRDQLANPPGAGNEAEYREWIRKTKGVKVEEAFIYPNVFGPPTTGWTFTVSPGRYGSRIPSSAQIGLVTAELAAKAPRTDPQFFLPIVEEELTVCAEVTWDALADGWADETPWPEYFADPPTSGSGAVVIDSATSPLACVIETTNGVYTTCGDVAAGMSLGLWDAPRQKWRRKTVLTVAGTGPWTVTFDGTFSASDTTYTPVAGQRVSPWSDSLLHFEAPVVAFFESVGPGEAHTPGWLDGQRGRRYPAPPKSWPDRTTKALESGLESLASVDSLDLVEGGQVVASPSTTPRLLVLADFAVYPE
jgi:uncharacterized phage protein gp47/JayE